MKKALIIVCTFVWACGVSYAGEAPGISVQSLVKSTLSWDGSRLPGYPEGQPEITILRIVIPPKTELPMHEHPVINAGVLLKGSLTVVKKDGTVLYLNEGDPIVEVVESWHYGKNEGDQPAEIIVFYAGVKGKDITVKQ